MTRQTIKYTLTCSFFLLTLFWVSYSMGSNPLIDARHFLFDMVIFFIFIFLACREYKHYHNSGIFHFWQAMSIGFLVYFPASIIFLLIIFICFSIEPDFFIDYQAEAIEYLKLSRDSTLKKLTDQEFNQQLEETKDLTLLALIVSIFLKKNFTGFFITPLIGVILRKHLK